MSESLERPIARLANGLQLDGRTESGNTVLLKDGSGNVVIGIDANGRLYGTAFTPRVASVTATANGLTTGIIPANVDIANITSSGATQAVSLPAADATTIGHSIILQVGANGYELLTEASSNDTINTVDADGTNQLDVAANTMAVATQVTATAWFVYQVAATTITVVAPDND